MLRYTNSASWLLSPLLVAVPVTANSSTPSSTSDSLIKNYTIAPRFEPYGSAAVGYPQICIRTNMPDQRVDMQGIFEELSSDKNITHPSQLLPKATALAASGKLGHVWTIFFESEKDWKSWSFRSPEIPTGEALNKNNWWDSPQRKFNYQYCVSMKGKPIDDAFITDNFVKPLIEESRHIASSIYPNIEFVGGVYSPVTPCVWFATKLFNKATGLKIPYEQHFDWSQISKLINQPGLENFNSIPDAGVVAEAISKKVKWSFRFSDDLNAIFTHNKTYQTFNVHTANPVKSIEENSFGGKVLSPFYENYKTAFIDGQDLHLIDYLGRISIFNIDGKQFWTHFENVPFKDVIKGVDFEAKEIVSTIPLYQGMPYYSANKNQHLLFLSNGDTYLLNSTAKTIRKTNYFPQYAPHLQPYVKRVLGSSQVNDDSVIIYLTNRKYIEINLTDLSIVGSEKNIEEHPIIGRNFKLQ
ncbi:hypothetical protein [Vibrio cholerae]|uniref:hypothetical protein n=1 Tax=Vibrio cholerae TaxID=666 RepID=UPI0011581F74|nr:hypothetical protein [Vibrio cholerae]TQQ78342.1 hypothetical protein FLL59_00005 [Vibrio cholerae]